MSTTITTVQKSNAQGRTQVVAKGGGKQRTVNYRHDWSIEANHFNAMWEVAQALNLPVLPRTETVEVDKGRSRTVLG